MCDVTPCYASRVTPRGGGLWKLALLPPDLPHVPYPFAVLCPSAVINYDMSMTIG